MSLNVTKAIEFGIQLIGTPYDYWKGGINQAGAPMFAENGKLPDIKDIKSANCAGLCNLILRSIGKELPYDCDTIGGTESYFNYYSDKSHEFKIEDTYPIGTLLIRNYRNIDDQGHVAIILENKGKSSLVLQSHVEGEYHVSTKPGVNSNYTLEQSHNSFTNSEGIGCCYEKIVLPQDWLY